MTTPTNLIDQVVSFYGTYLSCSPEQLDILALWTFHTHSVQTAHSSPALNIHSREKQSGKTTCLELLQMLCHHSFLHTSPSPALVVRQTQSLDESYPLIPTLLLDDCRFSTALQGVLSASFRWSGVQIVRSKDKSGNYVFQERSNFFPKAFAGNHRLPDCLRDVSIPIALEPKKPGSPCRRLLQGDAEVKADALWMDIHRWYEDSSEALAEVLPCEPSQFPPELSSRQQDCAEPLLQIADFIGGEWPQRARVALVNVFALSAFEDFYASKQVFTDIVDLFAAKDNPGWLSTNDVLESLHTLDDRAWDEWSKGKPLTSKDLAALLAPFGIKSKNHRAAEGDKVAKGYNLQDFLASSKRHILTELFRRSKKEMEAAATGVAATSGSAGASLAAGKNLAVDSQGSAKLVAGSQQPAAGSVAANQQNSLITGPKPIANPATAGSQHSARPVAGSQKLEAGSVAANPQDSVKPSAVLSCQAKEASSQKLVAGSASSSQKPDASTKPKIIIATKVYAGQQHKPEYIYAED